MAEEIYGEVSLGVDVRNALRRLAHEVYARLVMLRHVKENNRLENNLTVVIYSLIALVSGAGSYFLAGVTTPFEVAAFEVKSLDPLVAAIGGAFGAIAFSLFVFGERISDFSLRFVGRIMIYGWRRLPGKKYRLRREQMLQTINGWLQSNPDKPAEEIGRDVRHVLPKPLIDALGALGRKKGDKDYLIFRGLLERKYKAVYSASWFRSRRPNPDDAEDPRSYFVRARDLRDALKINLIFHYLGADLRDETPDGANWKREYFTSPEKQQLILWDENDLATRFRTSGPHLRWPRDEHQSQTNSAGEAPIYVAIACIENPLEIPLYLLPVDDIINCMPQAAMITDPEVWTKKKSAQESVDQAIKVLRETPVPMFAKKEKTTLRALGGVDAPERPVMRHSKGSEEIRWDPNRILWDRLDPATSSDLLQALAMVLLAIEVCISREEKNEPEGPRVRRVILRRGDLLITDNQRTLVCRRESDFYNVKRTEKLAVGMPPQWWLRGFYGFRIAGSEEQRIGR